MTLNCRRADRGSLGYPSRTGQQCGAWHRDCLCSGHGLFWPHLGFGV